jgi:proliferating cell nuclear antigen
MVGLEMKKLKELISLGAADDIISMTYDGKGDVLMNLGKIDRSSRPLDNNTLNPPNLPNLDLPCSVTIRGSELAQAFRAARQVGDLVTLSIDPEKFTIHVSGPNDSVTVVYGHDELQGITCDSPAKSQYSLTYLVPLGKVFNSIESVTIAFGENFPLAMDFTFSDGSGSVKYFLAPRVEQEGY